MPARLSSKMRSRKLRLTKINADADDPARAQSAFQQGAAQLSLQHKPDSISLPPVNPIFRGRHVAPFYGRRGSAISL